MSELVTAAVEVAGSVVTRWLVKQVQKILDEGEGKKRQVLVRLNSPNDQGLDFVEKLSDVFKQRRLLLQARSLRPVHLDKLRRKASGELDPKARNSMLRMKGSLVGQMASIRTPFDSAGRTPFDDAGAPAHLKHLRKLASDVIDPFVKHNYVKAINEKKRQNNVLWAARSVVLELTKDELAKLPSSVPDIAEIHPNRPVSLPSVSEVHQEQLPAEIRDQLASAWGLQKINAMAAWGAYDARGKGSTVAVLDTGVDFTHPALSGKQAGWAEFDNDGKPVAGSVAHDSHYHGTHCAGTIAGGSTEGKHIGVAPQAKIAGVLVLNGERGGTDAQILAGIEWAIEQHVDVISMSLGGLTLTPETPNTYTRAILTALMAGIPVVTSIGNEGNQTTGTPGNDQLAYAVGATDHRDLPAGFSGGRTHIIYEAPHLPPEVLPFTYMKPEVSAPGVAIFSCAPGAKSKLLSGTSMAAPHVAGSIALLLSAAAKLREVSPRDRGFLLQDLITSSVEELGEVGQNHRYGYGRIDVLRAIAFAHEQGYG
ncbi:MAG: S8 family serine peptidase [Planctomycetes bacterium]|nr:S8 family serine peptidase [Planctomycetota bacterium]